MRTSVKIIIGLLVVTGIGAAAYKPAVDSWKLRNKTKWRTEDVTKGGITAVVNSTGTVKPEEQVTVGSFVSGPLVTDYEPLPEEIEKEQYKGLPDFNDPVAKDQILAVIDPRIYEANVARDEAGHKSREADVNRVKAQLQQAINDERRAIALRKEDQSFIAQSEMDKFKYARMSLDAQLVVAKASEEQAKQALEYSKTQLGYTKILSPVDGIVIHRKIDKGQMLASQFQAPELYIIGVNMKVKMHIHASVDEADIGLILNAERRKLPVTFTVDAYPDELFKGVIDDVRINSNTTQNVVTYPVIVAAPNPDMKLLPGMTASISFHVDERKDVVKIPNAALRFYPDLKKVRKEDHALLEGTQTKTDEEEAQQSDATLSAEERAELRSKRNRRHVWIEEGEFLRAVEITTGLSDSQFTEMVSGNLKPGDKLVTGIVIPQYGVPQ